MEPLDQDFYSVREAAALLRCNERAILRMIKRTELPAMPHGKSYRFRREDLEAFVERCERTGSWPTDRR